MLQDFSSLLYRALEEEFGLIVHTSDPDRLIQRLYPARKKHEIFKLLSFVRRGDEIWIVKRKEP